MQELDRSHMELVENGYTICSKCGTEYNNGDQEPPEDASFYWVPKCPDCNAKITTNPTNQTWLNIISTEIGSGDRISPDSDNYEWKREKLHAHARLYHGRLAGLPTEELIRRAKFFDRQAKTGKALGPRFYRDIAFALRKQARNQ